MKDVNLLIQNGVNVNASLELFGDMETYDETVVDFLDGVGQKLEDIKKYKENGDMQNYAILVHSLKSDSKYLGLTTLAELAYNHEMESKANNINFVYQNYDSLMAEAARMVGVLSTYMGVTPAVAPVTQEASTPVVKDKTILVVDDSDVIRTFIQKVFDNTYNVMVAHDGKEALDIVTTGAEGNKIVAMLLDLNMPNVNGFEVLDYFNNNNLFISIPVSIITGDDSKETTAKAYNYPISGVLQKPFNERDIRIVIEKMLSISQ